MDIGHMKKWYTITPGRSFQLFDASVEADSDTNLDVLKRCGLLLRYSSGKNQPRKMILNKELQVGSELTSLLQVLDVHVKN